MRPNIAWRCLFRHAQGIVTHMNAATASAPEVVHVRLGTRRWAMQVGPNEPWVDTIWPAHTSFEHLSCELRKAWPAAIILDEARVTTIKRPAGSHPPTIVRELRPSDLPAHMPDPADAFGRAADTLGSVWSTPGGLIEPPDMQPQPAPFRLSIKLDDRKPPLSRATDWFKRR